MGANAYNNGKKLEETLGPDKMAELDLLFEKAAPMKDIVPVVKDKWGLFPELSAATVSTILYRYRREITKKEITKRVIAAVGTEKHLKVIDTMGELTSLIDKQRTRIDKVFGVEAKSPLLMSQVTGEMRLLKEMCRDLAYLQIETGILPRAPKVMQGAGMLTDAAGNTTKFLWQQSDEALLNRLESPKTINADPEPA